MFVTVNGPVKKVRIKLPEEFEKVIKKKYPDITRQEISTDMQDFISWYYYKVVSEPIANFIIKYHSELGTPEGYPVYDEMKIGNLGVSVIGYTRNNEAHTFMIAYREKKKPPAKQKPKRSIRKIKEKK